MHNLGKISVTKLKLKIARPKLCPTLKKNAVASDRNFSGNNFQSFEIAILFQLKYCQNRKILQLE